MERMERCPTCAVWMGRTTMTDPDVLVCGQCGYMSHPPVGGCVWLLVALFVLLVAAWSMGGW